eukprot:gene11166-biopygen16841
MMRSVPAAPLWCSLLVPECAGGGRPPGRARRTLKTRDVAQQVGEEKSASQARLRESQEGGGVAGDPGVVGES